MQRCRVRALMRQPPVSVYMSESRWVWLHAHAAGACLVQSYQPPCNDEHLFGADAIDWLRTVKLQGFLLLAVPYPRPTRQWPRAKGRGCTPCCLMPPPPIAISTIDMPHGGATCTELIPLGVTTGQEVKASERAPCNSTSIGDWVGARLTK